MVWKVSRLIIYRFVNKNRRLNNQGKIDKQKSNKIIPKGNRDAQKRYNTRSKYKSDGKKHRPC